MPPVMQFRQGSTGLGSGSTWEPYPKNSHMNHRESLHKPSLSFSFPCSPPTAMSALKLPQTISTPTILPSMTSSIEELNFVEIGRDVVSKLVKQSLLQSNGNSNNTILLLDMRPAVCHAVSSIASAVSVSVPNILLKRPMYTLGMIADQLTTESEMEAFSNWRNYSNIVLFDATGSVPVKGTPTFCMALKLRREGYNGTLAYIHGGYNAFALEYPSLCCSDGMNPDKAKSTPGSGSINIPSEKPAPSSNISPTRCRLHLGSLPTTKLKSSSSAASVCQTPMIENPNANPLFENVRLAMGLNTHIAEEVSVRFPSRFPIDNVRNQLPAWLSDSINEEKGKTILAEYFQKIEIAEKKRLAILMAPQEMMCGKKTELSICAGLEKGYKNRYNHVWPFDHTRVRIKEYEAGGDDYINASFLRPPFGQKSYIVTQGPLPDTFQDFWKVMWEQDSRVIIMLTREFEMGRIKCHRYWPTSDSQTMSFGPIRVSLVSDCQSGNAIDNILVRKFKLSHVNQPDMPERIITHVQYTGWPDFGVPESPLEVLKLIEIANANNTPTPAGPMVVHCSAGCGRTGAFCVIDSILSEIKSNPDKKLSSLLTPSSSSSHAGSQTALKNDPMKDLVYVTVNRFREQRLSMIQCLRQYVFCYESILWHIVIELSKAQGLILPLTPRSTRPPSQSLISSCSLLSKDSAPATPSNEEFSFFG